MAQTPKIDALPAKQRQQVVRILTAALTEHETPNYRELTSRLNAEFGLNLGYTAVQRYTQRYVVPLIKQAVSTQTNDAREVAVGPHETEKAVVDATERRLEVDPIKSWLEAQRLRLEGIAIATAKTEQYDTSIRAESVLGATIERTAKAIQHPGFSTAQAASTNVQVVLVLPRQGDVQRRIEGTGVVEAEVVG